MTKKPAMTVLRFIKWAGLVFTLSILLIGECTRNWDFGWFNADCSAGVYFAEASLYVEWSATQVDLNEYLENPGFQMKPVYHRLNSSVTGRIEFWKGGLCLSRIDSTSFLQLPLWMIFLLCTILTAGLFRRDNRKARLIFGGACCEVCRYDLAGNVSGICPECGTPVRGARADDLRGGHLADP